MSNELLILGAAGFGGVSALVAFVVQRFAAAALSWLFPYEGLPGDRVKKALDDRARKS